MAWARVVLFVGVLVLALLGGTACERIERVALDDAACDVACRCEGAILPTALEICVADCVENTAALSDPCLECVSTASCADLALDACDEICFDRP